MIVFDIETDGLKLEEITKIHCICTYVLEENKVYTFSGSDNEIRRGIQFLLQGSELNPSCLIGHNIISYDIPVIQKFYPSFKPEKVIDTLVLARMMEPDRQHGHSLESYGKQFGLVKVQNKDWKETTENIVERCEVDVQITTKLFEHFLKELNAGIWDRAVNLENQIVEINSEQAEHGWKLNIPLANILASTCKDRIQAIDIEIEPLLNKRVVRITTVNKPFKKDGTLSAQSIRYCG